ncbi:MAG: KH domain-containing protein [archaeon]
MHSFYVENIQKVIKNKNLLEKKLKVKLTLRGHNINISGNETNEYFAVKVFEAIDSDFPLNIALLLTDSPEEYMIEHLNIKDFTRRSNLAEIRARIVGRKGKTRKTMEELSACYISLHDNTVSIIGQAEDMENATQALVKLIKGSKQSSVYGFLERVRNKTKGDLGLRKI